MTVVPSERILSRIDFASGLGGLRSDGSFAAAGSARATLHHSDAVGNGAAALQATLADDGIAGNWTYQELRVRLSRLPKSVTSGPANKVRFDLFVPEPSDEFFLASGLRFYLPTGKTADFPGHEAWARDLPTMTIDGQPYLRYSAAIPFSEVGRPAALAIQVITKDVDYEGPVYLDDVRFIEALVDAPQDPTVIDTFEHHADAATRLGEMYARNAGGNRVELTLDGTHKRGRASSACASTTGWARRTTRG